MRYGDMEGVIIAFIAAAILAEQKRVIDRYRQGRKGTVWVAFTSKDDGFLDLTERAICQLGFDDNDFPPCEQLESTFAMLPCDIN